MKPNWLVIGIQPLNSLQMEVTVKEPGLEMKTRRVSMDASIVEAGERVSDAYEGLLLDVIEGDRTLFLRNDEVDYAWRIVEPVLNAWAGNDYPIFTYPAGSWGPQESRVIFDKETTWWRHDIELVDCE